MPDGVRADDLKAGYRDGILDGILELTATMPREAAHKEVKIEIEDHQAKKDEGPKTVA